MSTAIGLKRPGTVGRLAILQVIPAVLWLFGGLVCIVVGLVTPDNGPVVVTHGMVFVALGIALIALGSLSLACAIGLWRLRGYGRTIQLVYSWIGLLGFPF